MLARFRRRIGLIGVLAVFFVSGAHGPANSASTDSCLAAPNTPAPDGSHWFDRIDLQGTVKCWYLRMTGQTEQKTSAPDKPATASHAPASHATSSHAPASRAAAAHATGSHVAASHETASHVTAPKVSASHVQLIRRSSSSILGAEPPGNEESIGRDDGPSPSPGVGSDALGVALQSRAIADAPADKTFARTAPEDGSSPSIEVIRVRNSNEIPVGDQADAPRAPVRVVWPSPISEVRPAPAVSKVDAKDQSALLVRPEADATVSADVQSAAEPGAEASGASRVGKLAVLIFVSFGLPGAGILAWLVMKADNARGAQFAANHLRRSGADGRRSTNKRHARGANDRREADWLDDFLGRLAERPKTAVPNTAVASVDPVQPRADVADVVLRNILMAFRRKAAAGYDSGNYAAAQRRMVAR
jgi:hypothetical protein